MLFAALGLHALLLFTPFPTEPPPRTPDDKKDPVKITQIPTSKSPKPKTVTPKINVKQTLPKISRPATNPPPPLPKPATPAPPPEAPPAPAQNAQTPQNAKDPFADFPYFTPATPDCFNKGLGESCSVASANLTTVSSHFNKALPGKKFTLTPDEQAADKQVFQVSKDGATRYLHLFTDGPTTVILLAPDKIADLSTLKGAVVPPEDYYALLGDVLGGGSDRDTNPATNASWDQFEQPDFFFKPISNEELLNGTPREVLPGIADEPKIALGQPPDAFYSTFLEADLKSIFTKGVTKEGSYGGGNLYRLQTDKATIFLSLVPLKEQTGTIIVTWLRDPRS